MWWLCLDIQADPPVVDADCTGCKKCSKDVNGTKRRELCHLYYFGSEKREACVWNEDDSNCYRDKKSEDSCGPGLPLPPAPPALPPGTFKPPSPPPPMPPPSPPPFFSELECPAAAFRCCVVLYTGAPGSH